MISKGRKKILEVFMDSPQGEFYLRQIAKKTGIAINNTYRYLYQFVEKEFLLTEEKDNKKYFRLNLNNNFLLKTMEYLEVERKEEFFKEHPEMSNLKEVAQEIKKVMEGVAMILFDKSKGDVIVIVKRREHVLESYVMNIITLKEFGKNLDENLLANRVVLHNEFCFWKTMSELPK